LGAANEIRKVVNRGPAGSGIDPILDPCHLRRRIQPVRNTHFVRERIGSGSEQARVLTLPSEGAHGGCARSFQNRGVNHLSGDFSGTASALLPGIFNNRGAWNRFDAPSRLTLTRCP